MPIQTVSKGALTQARSKLQASAFSSLSKELLADHYQQEQVKKWKGHRLLSVDGSTTQVPRSSSTEEYFGIHMMGPKVGRPTVMARVSILSDLLNRTILDGQMGKFATSEMELLTAHLPQLNPGDLLLLDRGYASIPLFITLTQMGCDFLCRLPANWWKVARKLSESKAMSSTETLTYKPKPNQKAHFNLAPTQIKVRLIKTFNKDGDPIILCTSLTNTRKYNRKKVAQLYLMRWSIEEDFKLLKTRMKFTMFSGRTALAIRQDFQAALLLFNIATLLSTSFVNQAIKRKKRATGKTYKENKTFILAEVRRILIQLLQGKAAQFFYYFQQAIYQNLELVRPNRSVERRKESRRRPQWNYKGI